MLAAMANGDSICVGKEKPTRKVKPCGCGQPLRDEFGRFAPRVARPVCPPVPVAPRWGVCGEPKEDKNKVFGLSVRVDEPTPDMFNSRWAFERAHAKFDRLVDAVEAVDWQNKSNTAPLHKVNCIRKRIQDGPVFGVNLVGESRWFE
jgi:hypothetical protein